MEEVHITARRDGSAMTFESYDAEMLFQRGTETLNRGACVEAVERFYDRLLREFASSRFVSPTLYNAGYCLHHRGDLARAVRYYERLLADFGAGRDARDAAFQLADVYLQLEAYAEALRTADRVLLWEDLRADERLEGMTRRAQALLGLARLEEAARQARGALRYFRQHAPVVGPVAGAVAGPDRPDSNASPWNAARTRIDDDNVGDPFFAAAANYVLAETLRRRSEAIELPRGTASEQHRALDQRSRLLLAAQAEYFNAMRFRDARWTAAAGYRVGAMYEVLWRALMRAPVPPPERSLESDSLDIYREEYRTELARRIRPLVRHAIRFWEMTMLMVERTGVETEWAARTQADLDRMRALVLDENPPPPSSPVRQPLQRNLPPSDSLPGSDAGSEPEAGEPTSRLIRHFHALTPLLASRK